MRLILLVLFSIGITSAYSLLLLDVAIVNFFLLSYEFIFNREVDPFSIGNTSSHSDEVDLVRKVVPRARLAEQ